LTAAVLIAIGVIRAIRNTPVSGRRSKIGIALLAAALIAAGVALSAVVFGPWSIAASHRRTLISVGVFSKPLSIAVLFAIIALGFNRRLTAAFRRRSVFTFYVIAAAISYVLAFGPQPRFLDRQIL